MASTLISGLRSVALNVPDLRLAEAFYTNTWRLLVASRTEDSVLLRGSGADDHLLALYQTKFPSSTPQVRQVTLRAASLSALHDIARLAIEAGGSVVSPVTQLRNASGEYSLKLTDLDGRIFEIVLDDVARTPLAGECSDIPVRLAHVVLNAHDVDSAQAFLEKVFNFRLIDKTAIMAFMNCNSDHHSIAFGITDNDALNHIAFVMPNVDAVMRGGGRLRDAGHAIEWGPGRHGPGNNTFNYFIDPFGIVIEYTADVEQVDDSYVVRMPADWKWPQGRFDQWGISAPPSAKLKEAQKLVRFVRHADE
jgi:catechol 2,3-dioxygenase-like lactoylglutathione lyase family enzyme